MTDTIEPEATPRTRDTGLLVWQVASRTDPDAVDDQWQDVEAPPFADLAAARKWLVAQLESGALVAGVYRPCRIHGIIVAKVETQVRVSLT